MNEPDNDKNYSTARVGVQLTKMNFTHSISCPSIASIETDMSNNNSILFTDTTLCNEDHFTRLASPIPSNDSCSLQETNSDLDGSQELYSSGEISLEYSKSQNSGYEDIIRFNTPSPTLLSMQGGKRCGVIFIDVNNQTIVSNSLSRAIGSTPARIQELENSNKIFPREKIFSFLVVKGRVSNIWSFPKGRMKSEYETEEECALREVFEETGIRLLTVKDLPRIVIGRNVYFIKHTTKNEFQSFVIQDKYEVGEVAWKTTNELRKLTANKDVRATLIYPRRVFSYHNIIYYPPQMRTKYSFKNVTKMIENDQSIEVS